MPTARVIKRYSNRKLYDTETSRYVKLDEIAAMLEEGEEVRIIDNKTKEDLTRVTLAQILVEHERRRQQTKKDSTFRGFIRDKGEMFSRKITEPVTSLRTSVEEGVNRLIKTGEERAVETKNQLQSWVDQNTLALEELQSRVDDRLRDTMARLDVIGTLRTQVDDLEERVGRLEAALLAAREETPAPTKPPETT